MNTPHFAANITWGSGRLIVSDQYGLLWRVDSDTGLGVQVQFLHASDCAVNNAPALPTGDCDCVGSTGGS